MKGCSGVLYFCRRQTQTMFSKKLLPVCFAVVITGCFLVKDYSKRSFAYSAHGQAATLPVIVPRGYLKQESADTAGIRLQAWYYPGGAMIYTAYLNDTTAELQPISKAVHQPQVHRLGGLIFKGQDENELFYREIRRGNFRFGYRFVPRGMEWEFDSSTNYASLQVR